MTTTTAPQPNRLRGNLIGVAVILLAALMLVLGLAANDLATCSGYLNLPPRNQMSDLYGGAVGQQLPQCRDDK